MSAVTCPAWLISAPASGQGKTLVTAGIAQHHRNNGRRVRVFKTGPDFLDPMVLEAASGAAVYQLDLWMVGEDDCRTLLARAAQQADLVLIEGVMGLFDGTPSSADLAQRLGVPVLAVIDAAAMAETFGAVAEGLARFRPGLPFAGVVANRVASAGHAQMLSRSVSAKVPYLGSIRADRAIELGERHLGLIPAPEIGDLEGRLALAAAAVAETELQQPPAAVSFTCRPCGRAPALLRGLRIGVARDAAFSFLYRANLDLLRALGATLWFFSPLADEALPEVDSLYLPGGYPELFIDQLEANATMKEALRAHHRAGRAIYAECGGMLYLLETLIDAEGKRGAMVGVIAGEARQQSCPVAIGLQSVRLPFGEMRGHSFHHTRSSIALAPVARATYHLDERTGEAVYQVGSLLASYLHLYFPSNPAAAARLFTG
jgi:cobyrinic acid a,c-diamide synthase